MLQFEVCEVDIHRIILQLDGAIASIQHFQRTELGDELGDWQREDMHRKVAFVMRSRRRGTARTTIRPHSLYEMLRSEGVNLPVRVQRRLVRGIRSKLGHPLARKFYATMRQHRHWSTRDILRQELLTKLYDRMVEAAKEHIGFHRGRPDLHEEMRHLRREIVQAITQSESATCRARAMTAWWY